MQLTSVFNEVSLPACGVSFERGHGQRDFLSTLTESVATILIRNFHAEGLLAVYKTGKQLAITLKHSSTLRLQDWIIPLIGFSFHESRRNWRTLVNR